MKSTVKVVITVGILAVLLAGAVLAQKPVRNVNARRHPNIAAAQRMCANAFARIVAAQKANEFDMEGHAQKAKDLLQQASDELKLAAKAANQNKQ